MYAPKKVFLVGVSAVWKKKFRGWGHFKKKASFRNGVKEVIEQLKVSGALSLISGDNETDKASLIPIFKNESLYFNQKSIDKLNYLKGLQDEDAIVAMVGDGLNDAGALKQSDVGIVLTEDTSNFTPACDVIMDAKHFSKLPALFGFAKDTINIVLVAYAIALVYNIIGLSFAVQGLLSPVIAAILMPLSSISIVVFGTAMSGYFAKKRIPFTH